MQVQGNVRGIDPRRTDVVTVSERVSLRPDIAATSLGGPEQARVNTSVVFSAAIGELNGDVGATTNCVLYVDGVEADRANGVWVAEGDHVSCDFVHTFTAVGAHTVRVAAEAVNPGDWDAANNSRETTIQITAPQASSLHGSASASESRFENWDRQRGTWSSGDGSGSWLYEYGDLYESQEVSMYGSAPTGLNVWQASVEFAVSSGGTERVFLSEGVQWVWGDCAFLWRDNGWVHVCSNGTNTWVNAGHGAHRATYFSRGYSEAWYHWSGEYYYWEHDYRNVWAYSGFEPYGTQVDLSFRVTDGAQIYAAAPSIAVGGVTMSWDSPESCDTYTEPYDNYSSEVCIAPGGKHYHGYGWADF